MPKKRKPIDATEWYRRATPEERQQRILQLRLRLRRASLVDKTHEGRHLEYMASGRLAKAQDKAERRLYRVLQSAVGQDRFKLRQESRSAHLAYGFIRGKPYVSMERMCYRPHPDWKRIAELVGLHMAGEPATVRQRFANWLDDAKKDGSFFGNKMRKKLPPAPTIRELSGNVE